MKKTRKEIKREACIQLKYLIDEYIDAEGKEDMKIDISIERQDTNASDDDINIPNAITTHDAVDALRKDLSNDDEYAFTWQANLAMCFYDAYFRANDKNAFSREEELEIHIIANDAARDFLEKLKI